MQQLDSLRLERMVPKQHEPTGEGPGTEFPSVQVENHFGKRKKCTLKISLNMSK